MGYYGWRGRFYEVDPGEVGIAEAICDRCGFRFNLKNMQWQYDYRGSATMQNTRVMVCGRPSCLDVPNVQISPLILEADPVPLANARPEPYTIDETNWLATEDNEIIEAQDGDDFITPIPNPADNPATSNLTCSIVDSGGSVATVYLDLFSGDPSSGGTSVLALITGSAIRTDIASALTTDSNIATNPSAIIIATESANTVNVSWAGLYSAAISGALLMSGPVSASPIISEGNPVQFNALGLTIDLS